MFEFVDKNRQFASVALGLVGLGLLVGGGVAGYSASGETDFLAKVDGVKIGERELAAANNGQPVADAAKPQLLQEAVQRQLMLNETNKQYVRASDAQLREQILKIPAFKDEKGQFSPERYKELVAARQMTVQQFEAKLAEDMRLQQLVGSLLSSSITSKAAGDRLITALATPRDVAMYRYTPERYLDQVKLTDADIKQYYDSHQADYRLPERVKLDYVVLSRDEFAQSITVDAAKVQAYFDAHKGELAPEERQVRHILIKADAGATAAVKAAAKQKAEKLLAEIKQNGSRFAELAKQNSDDPGSAAQGGDLGFFGRGSMVKPFEESAFKLKKGELSDLVETQYGYHILQLTDVRSKTVAELTPVIEQRIRLEEGQKRFQAEAENFSTLVYQQADSLQPAATAYKLTIKHSDWVSRDAATDPLLNNAKLREAVFGEDVLTKKHNSDAVEVQPGTMLAARVAAHEPAKLQPLAEVSTKISDTLKRERAVKLAQEAGKQALADLQAGKTPAVEWSAAKPVSRLQNLGLDKASVDAVFAVPAAKLPGYAGAQAADGYSLYRVAASVAPPLDPAMRANLGGSLGQMAGQQDLLGYLGQLRKAQKVELK
ncbi:peptidyl-prolyl isomerase family protein [Chitinimonas naiadis]